MQLSLYTVYTLVRCMNKNIEARERVDSVLVPKDFLKGDYPLGSFPSNTQLRKYIGPFGRCQALPKGTLRYLPVAILINKRRDGKPNTYQSR